MVGRGCFWLELVGGFAFIFLDDFFVFRERMDKLIHGVLSLQ